MTADLEWKISGPSTQEMFFLCFWLVSDLGAGDWAGRTRVIPAVSEERLHCGASDSWYLLSSERVVR